MAILQADECLTSSQQLLMKNDYVAAAAAISRAETLLLELQQAEANAASPSAAVGRGWGGSGKENRPNHAAGTVHERER